MLKNLKLQNSFYEAYIYIIVNYWKNQYPRMILDGWAKKW
jgi:hypothetical protein